MSFSFSVDFGGGGSATSGLGLCVYILRICMLCEVAGCS